MTDNIKDSHQIAKRTPKALDAIQQFIPFFANDHHAFLVKKAERLATALHLVTNYIAPDEPIRARLRNAALDVVAYTIDLERLGSLGAEAFGGRCAGIAALLETAQMNGMVSSSNAKLLCDEYAALAQFTRDRFSLIRSRSSDLFVPLSQPSSLGFFKGQKDIVPYRTVQKIERTDKGLISGTRRAHIIELFNTKKRISIKDAVFVVPDVSEKTLQRELLSMVEEGLLIKEGERRWSTYRKALSQ